MSRTNDPQVGYAKKYFERYHHASRYLLLLEMAKPQPEWRALDVGCGVGSATFELAPYVKEVIACDSTDKLVEAAREQFANMEIHNVTFATMSPNRFEFEDNYFDLVISTAMLHHTLDPMQMLREAKRVLKRGGKVAIWDIIGSKSDIKRSNQNLLEQLRDPSHIELLSAFEIQNLLETLGFEVIELQQMKINRNLEEWLSLTNPPESQIEKIKRLMKEWSIHDEADIDPKEIDGRFHFTQNSLAVVARKL